MSMLRWPVEVMFIPNRETEERTGTFTVTVGGHNIFSVSKLEMKNMTSDECVVHYAEAFIADAMQPRTIIYGEQCQCPDRELP